MKMIAGQFVNLDAHMLDADSKNIDTFNVGLIQWASDDPTVAEVIKLVSGAVRIKAVSAGTANITASYGSVTSSLEVVVAESQVPTSILINAGSITNKPT